MSELAEVAVNLRGSRDDCESASEMVMSTGAFSVTDPSQLRDANKV